MQPDDENGYLDIGIKWSRIRPVRIQIPQGKITFTSVILRRVSLKYLYECSWEADYGTSSQNLVMRQKKFYESGRREGGR